MLILFVVHCVKEKGNILKAANLVRSQLARPAQQAEQNQAAEMLPLSLEPGSFTEDPTLSPYVRSLLAKLRMQGPPAAALQ